MSRQSTQSIPGEYEPADKEVGNDTVLPTNKDKGREPKIEAPTSEPKIDISNYAIYRSLTESNPSKSAIIIKVANREELRRALVLKGDGDIWYTVLAGTLLQHEVLIEKYQDLKKRNKDLKGLQAEWTRMIKSWDHERLVFEEDIAAEKLETQKVKAENSDLIREISEMKRLAREATQTSTSSTGQTEDQSAVAAPLSNYRPKGTNPKEALDGSNSDAYRAWAFTVERKIRTDSPMYTSEELKIDYALSQMKDPIFDAIHTWVVDAGPTLSLNTFFKEIESYLGIAYLTKDAKKELKEISMNKDETVTEYYHRMFKLWQRAKIPADERIETFKDTLRPNIALSLLGRDFISLETLLHEARKIEQGRKEMNQKYAKSESQKPAKTTTSPSSSVGRGLNKTTTATSSTSITVKPKATTTNSAISANPNSKFGQVSTKPEGWVGAWYEGTLHPPKLEDGERETLSRQGRCWSCRGSGHRGRDPCCIRQAVNLSRVAIREDSSESEDSEKE